MSNEKRGSIIVARESLRVRLNESVVSHQCARCAVESKMSIPCGRRAARDARSLRCFVEEDRVLERLGSFHHDECHTKPSRPLVCCISSSNLVHYDIWSRRRNSHEWFCPLLGATIWQNFPPAFAASDHELLSGCRRNPGKVDGRFSADAFGCNQ